MSLRKSVTKYTGLTNKPYQKYKDFQHLSYEDILKIDPNDISTTALKNDTDTVLNRNQRSALTLLEFFKENDTSPYKRQEMIAKLKDKIEKREADRLLASMPEVNSEYLSLKQRLHSLRKSGGYKRKIRSTKKQNKKQKRRTYRNE
jgi:GrpB-like predicted nucleotidyltransferase (UPF0157 family)